MKQLGIITLVILFVGCGKAPSKAITNKHLSDLEFKQQAMILLAGKWVNHDEYEASEAWCNLRDSVEPTDKKQLSRWLILQKEILTTNSVPEGVKHSAIQEFCIYYETACEHETWLRQCQKSDSFRDDQFIKQNVNMIIDLIDKLKQKEAQPPPAGDSQPAKRVSRTPEE